MKSNLYRIILGLLVPILLVFLLFLFMGFEHGTTFWIGLCFGVFSYILMMAIPFFIPKSKSSHLFGFTSSATTSMYFGINIVVGLVLIFWDFAQWKIALGIEIVLLVAFLVLFLPILIVDEETARKETIRQRQIYTIKNMISQVQIIANKTTDMQTKKNVLRVYDELNSCPSKSNSATNSIDERIFKEIENLNSAINSNDYTEINILVEKLLRIIKERKEYSRF